MIAGLVIDVSTMIAVGTPRMISVPIWIWVAPNTPPTGQFSQFGSAGPAGCDGRSMDRSRGMASLLIWDTGHSDWDWYQSTTTPGGTTPLHTTVAFEPTRT